MQALSLCQLTNYNVCALPLWVVVVLLASQPAQAPSGGTAKGNPRKILQLHDPCYPSGAENNAYYDVLLDISVSGIQIEDLNDPGNFASWTSEYEEKYVEYLLVQIANSAAAAQYRDPDCNGTKITLPISGGDKASMSICDPAQLLYCNLDDTKYLDVTNNKSETLGTCEYDPFHTVKDDKKGKFLGVTVGYPCSFASSTSGMEYEFLLEVGGKRLSKYNCGSSGATCEPLEDIIDDLEEKLDYMKEKSGVRFIGLGLMPPLRNYLVRFATGVCACSAGRHLNAQKKCL